MENLGNHLVEHRSSLPYDKLDTDHKSDTPPLGIDIKSFSQKLYDSEAVNQFLADPSRTDIVGSELWHDLDISLSIVHECLRSGPELASVCVNAIFACTNCLKKILPLGEFHADPDDMQFQCDVTFEDETAFNAAIQLTKILSHLNVPSDDTFYNRDNSDTVKIVRETLESRLKHIDRLFWNPSKDSRTQDWMALGQGDTSIPVPLTEIFIMIQCALRVFQRAWDGNSNIGMHSLVGQALRALSLLRKLLSAPNIL